jgi:hypothetical protein
MNGGSDRCCRVERELADRGIPARVESVGEGGTIALVRPEGGMEESLLSNGREGIVDVCRAVGFRSAAIELYWE